ncbi:MAG TPA: hypothetical protein PKY99_02580, partial [Turneriella sp.]|nr:hypothetical protein [Turneriella sp.]
MRAIVLPFLLFFTVGGLAFAQNTATRPSFSPEEQERKIEILSEEIEKLKAGKELFPAVKATGKYGLGPAASKVYDVQQGVSIGG